MKKRTCEKLAKELLPYLPSYNYEKNANAICRVPVGHVFRGMIFSSSGFSSEAFYPEVFVQPLYVPVGYFTLGFGKRLLGNWQYEAGQEGVLASRLLRSMQDEGAFRLLDDLSSPETFGGNLGKYVSNQESSYVRQAIAYSFAISGQSESALLWLALCDESLKKVQQQDSALKWPSVMMDEINMLRAALARGPEAATKLLSEWTEYTRANLGLPA